jgi:Protein of unknown function (DUF1579)
MKIHATLAHLAPSLALAALAACSTTHQDVAPAAHQDAGKQEKMQLPPGWTEADMQACMAAGVPGAQHQQLARSVGHWSGTSTQWMAPGTEPVKSQIACDISSFLDGRFTKCEYSGEIPGMGPFHGLGFNGFDNVTQKYISIWLDNCGTGIMTGEGNASADGKTMTWNYRYNCPIAKKPATMRQVEKWTGDDTMVLEMFGNDPHSGKEYQMMHCEVSRSKP